MGPERGPVNAAGLIAHIDIKQCPTAGHIWRFTGLDPTSKWGHGEKRPWNAGLKTLCWHIRQSFMKLHNNETASTARYMSKGKLTSSSETTAAASSLRKTTENYKHLMAGHLPPTQIDARARRYAVKLFLAHEFGKPAPLHYPIAHMGHTGVVHPPH